MKDTKELKFLSTKNIQWVQIMNHNEDLLKFRVQKNMKHTKNGLKKKESSGVQTTNDTESFRAQKNIQRVQKWTILKTYCSFKMNTNASKL